MSKFNFVLYAGLWWSTVFSIVVSDTFGNWGEKGPFFFHIKVANKEITIRRRTWEITRR